MKRPFVLSDVLSTLLSKLLFCRHQNRTWPQTCRGECTENVYQVCLDCGRVIPYQGELTNGNVQRGATSAGTTARASSHT